DLLRGAFIGINEGSNEAAALLKKAGATVLHAALFRARHGVAAHKESVIGHEGIAKSAHEALCAAHIGNDGSGLEAATDRARQAVQRLDWGAHHHEVSALYGFFRGCEDFVAPRL